MTPITVEFAYWECDKANQNCFSGPFVPKQGVRKGPAPFTARIPRAFVTYAQPYSRNAKFAPFNVTVLPDRIVSPSINIDITYPDGIAYSIMSRNWKTLKPDLSLPGMGIGIQGWSKDRQLRATAMFATIQMALEGNDARWEIGNWERMPGQVNLDPYEGFKHTLGAGMEYFFDGDEDDIQAIECRHSSPHPVFFCNYYFALNSQIKVQLRFIDFRFHGGREFVRERIRAFKKAMCPILQCDDRALKSAGL